MTPQNTLLTPQIKIWGVIVIPHIFHVLIILPILTQQKFGMTPENMGWPPKFEFGGVMLTPQKIFVISCPADCQNLILNHWIVRQHMYVREFILKSLLAESEKVALESNNNTIGL